MLSCIYVGYTIDICILEVIILIAQITKWGNSQGIRLTRKALEEAGMKPDEKVIMLVEHGKITLMKSSRHRTLEERAAEYDGKLGPYTEFDWGEPVGREIL